MKIDSPRALGVLCRSSLVVLLSSCGPVAISVGVAELQDDPDPPKPTPTPRTYVYVALPDQQTLRSYRVQGSSFDADFAEAAASAGLIDLELSPSSKYLYALSGVDRTITHYEINANTGKPAAKTGSQTAGSWPRMILAHPSGRYLLSVDFLPARVNRFTIDSSDGSLTPLLPAWTDVDVQVAFDLVPDADGKRIYTASDRGIAVTNFDVDNGDLSRAAPIWPTSGFTLSQLLVSSDGKYLFGLDTGNSRVRVFKLGTQGEIDSELQPNTRFETGGFPVQMILSANRQNLYVSSFTNTITAFNIDANTGNLARVGQPVDLRSAPKAIAVHPAGGFLFAASSDGQQNTIEYFQVGSDGALSNRSSVPSVTSRVEDLVFFYNGTVNFPSRLGAFSRATEMRRTLPSTWTYRSSHPVVVHSNAGVAYCISREPREISVVSEWGGTAEVRFQIRLPSTPRMIQLGPADRTLEVLFDNNQITEFAIDPSTGWLHRQPGDRSISSTNNPCEEF